MSSVHPETTFDSVQGWFSLAGYAPLRAMSTRQWGQQILKRVAIRDVFDTLRTMPKDSPLRDWWLEQIEEQMQTLLTNPLAVIANDSPKLNPVRPMSLHEMENIGRKFERWYSVLAKQPLDKELPLDNLLGSNNFLGHLVINLAARDKDILAAFSAWLQTRRESFSNPSTGKTLRGTAILEWTGTQVIPFFDLILWGLWKGKKLTEDSIVNLLFPNEFDTEAHVKIRATTNAYKTYMTMANAAALISSHDG